MIITIKRVPVRLTAKRTTVNFHPIDETSNNSKGILILVHEHMKSKTLEILLPFFRSMPAIGSNAYNGTAVTIPKSKDKSMPFRPDSFPVTLVMISLFTQTSSKPTIIKMGTRENMKLM